MYLKKQRNIFKQKKQYEIIMLQVGLVFGILATILWRVLA